MKVIKQFSKLALLALFLSPAYSYAQSNTTEDEVNFSTVDIKPIYPGCADDASGKCFMESISKHIQGNFKYPEEAKKNNIEGKIFVHFRIAKDGSIDNVHVKETEGNQPNPLLKAEAMRLIKSLPKMTAAVNGGKQVPIEMVIPISFKLPAEGKKG